MQDDASRAVIAAVREGMQRPGFASTALALVSHSHPASKLDGNAVDKR